MMRCRTRLLIILAVIPLIKGVRENETTLLDSPQSRANSRIVKSYSRPRLQPVRCFQEGFQADPMDCTVFYRCVNAGRSRYNVYRFQCGPGTIYDPEAEICIHQQNTKRSECGILPLPSQESAESNHYNEIDSEQAVPFPISTNEPIILDRITDKTTTTFSWITAPVQQSLASSISYYPFPSLTDDICSKDGFTGDNKDCSKFYRCVSNGRGGYIRYEFSCTKATIWDEELQVCNHPWATKNSKCGGKIKKAEKFETTPSSYSSAQLILDPIVYATEKTFVQNQLNTESFKNMHYGDRIKKKQKDGAVGVNGSLIDKDIIATTAKYSFIHLPRVTNTEIVKPSTHSYLNSIKENLSDNQNIQEKEYITAKSPVSNYSKCSFNGFMRDQNDWKKFYRCVDDGKGGYNKYEFSCGEGTVWDSKIEACNHAWAVKDYGNDSNILSGSNTKNYSVIDPITQSSMTREYQNENENNYNYYNQEATVKVDSSSYTTERRVSGSNMCKSNGFIGDVDDCKKFYRCVNNGKGQFLIYEFSCGQGMEWDSELKTCNHPKFDNICRNKISYASNIQSSTLHNNNYKEQASNSKPTTTSKVSKSTGNDSCIIDGFFADSKDCMKFYRCVSNAEGGYIKYNFVCGRGTVWDRDTQSCKHNPDNKICNSHTTKKSIQGDQTEATVLTSKSTITTKKSMTTSSFNSVSDDCTDNGFYANTQDCTKFYRCVSNDKGGFIKYDFFCGEGTVWVQEIQACDHNSNSIDCNSRGSTISLSTLSTENNTEASVVTTSQSSNKHEDEYPTEPIPSQEPNTSNLCTSEGFFGNKEACKKFYRCVDNGSGGFTRYDFVCGVGTAWDTDLQTCNHESEIENCKSNNSSAKPIKIAKNDTDSSSTTTKGPSITTVESFSKSPQKLESDKCDQEGYFGNRIDCKKFYRCVDNGKGGFIRYDFDCGEGTIWDQDITTCNHPSDVVNPSCEESNKEDSSTGSPVSQTTSQTSISTSTTSSNDTAEKESNCYEKDCFKNSSFVCSKEGFYANPHDCKKFYRCVDWDGKNERFSIYHFDCGEGTIWDPALETCNYEDSVYPPRNCSCKQSMSESVEKSTTQESTTQEETTTQLTTQKETTTQATTQPETTTIETTSTTQQLTTAWETTETETESTTQSSTIQEETTATPTTTQIMETEQFTTKQEITTQQSTQEFESTTQETITEETTTYMTTESDSSTEQFTKEETTTQLSTKEQQSTTQETTIEQETTTQVLTTEQESVTRETTTEQEAITQESTAAQELTTQQSTIEQESTTQDITTKQYSTMEQQSTTREEMATQISTTENSKDETSTDNITDESQTEGATEENTTESSSHEQCPELDDDQYLFICETGFRRHPKYCNLFYQCSEDKETYEVKIAVFTCPNNTIYDGTKTKCVDEYESDKKCDGKIAERRRYKHLGPKAEKSMVVSRDLHSCTASGHYPFEKGNECSSVFMNCIPSNTGKLKPYVYKCPPNYVYWSVSRRCEQLAKLAHCRNLQKDWSQKREIPVERKNVAP